MASLVDMLKPNTAKKKRKKPMTSTKKKLLKGSHIVQNNDEHPQVRKATTQPNLEGVF